MAIKEKNLNHITVERQALDYEEDFKIMAKMYENYATELGCFTDYPIGPYLKEPDGNRSYNLIMHKDKAVGFVIFSTYPDSMTKHDVLIDEYYIEFEHRKKGIGRTFATMLLRAAEYKQMDITMAILDKNYKAKKFWDKTMGMSGYKELLIGQNIYAHDGDRPDLRWHYWTKSINS